MKKREEAYRSMVQEVLLMLANFIKIWQGNKLIADAVTIIRAKLKELNKYISIQQNVTKGLGPIKKKARSKLDKSTFVIYGIIRSYALAVDNKQLAAQYKAPITTIQAVKDTDMEALAESTQETVDKHKDQLMQFGLTQQTIDDYQKNLDDYLKALSAPSEAKKEQKYATERIAEIINELREIFDDHMDTYIIPYMLSEPEFYRTYQLARIIYDNPTHHHSMIGIVTNQDTGKPEENVTVEVECEVDGKKVTYTKITTKTGIFIFKTLPDGKCHVKFSKNYFDALNVDSAVYPNQTTKIDVGIRPTE